MTTETMAADPVAVDVSQDWVTACDVQERFMQYPCPTCAMQSVSYSARCRQVRALGGDCYDFLPLAQNRLAFAIGDASGKSVAAALMIAGVQASLRTAAAFAGNDPGAVLGAVNAHIHASSLADRYATVFYGVFDGSTRRLHYVNAGHNPPIVIRRDGSTMRLEAGGLPVGVFADSSYEEGVVQLRSGDMVVAYTDGVTEAANTVGEEWGIEGLCGAAVESLANAADAEVEQNADEIGDLIFAFLDEFSCGHQRDDATVVILRIH